MSLNFFKSTGFVIKELKLLTKDGVEQNIISFYQEINIFDSIMQPCLTGNILIKDSAGLINKFLFDGNDFLKIHIGKTEDIEDSVIKRIFRIYKLSDRQSDNQNSESYLLHFISEEYVTSLTQKVGQFFGNTTYTDNAVKILQDYMKVPESKLSRGYFDKSLGVRDNTLPGTLNPIESILWMTTRAVDVEHRPCFLFSENIFGYNFVSLSSLVKQDTLTEINFDSKHLNSSSEIKNFLGARYFKVIQQYDILSNIKNGVYSGKYVGYDKLVQLGIEIKFNYNSINHPKDPKNTGPSVSNLKTQSGDLLTTSLDSNLVLGGTCILSQGIKELREEDPGEMEKRINYEQILLQRPAIFANFFSQRVKLVVPGNFSISSGANVRLNVPKFSEKIPGENNLDRTLYGNYIIIASRHKLTPDNLHETIFEACTNSSNKSDSINGMIGMASQLPNQNYA
jgi:hypothetical protein